MNLSIHDVVKIEVEKACEENPWQYFTFKTGRGEELKVTVFSDKYVPVSRVSS